MAINVHDRKTTTQAGGPIKDQGRVARIVNMVMGTWLFVSAFVWAHTNTSQTNTWVVGLLVAGFAVLALWMSQARYLNTALGIWLFVSAFALPHAGAAGVWNNVLVAAIVFFASLVPSREADLGQRRMVRV